MTLDDKEPMPIDAELTVLFSRRELASAVQRLAREIRRDYTQLLKTETNDGKQGPAQEVLAIGVLKGAFVFMADLVRALDIPMTLDFVRVSTYGGGVVSSHKPLLELDTSVAVKGCHVLVVEDIVDTGVTTNFLLQHLREKGAASVRLCTLLSKPSRREVEVTIDYLGFTIGDQFVVGYGLDYAQRYRQLPDVCVLEER